MAHGMFTFARLTDELQVIKDWLDSNPFEFVILQFQQEYTSIKSTTAGNRIIDALNSVRFPIYNSTTPPIIGWLRKKAWIIEAAGVDFSNKFKTLSMKTGSKEINS